MKAVSMFQLCLADKIMYNLMDEKMATSLWSRLKILCMRKSLSNKLYLKKQLYGLPMNEGKGVGASKLL